MSVVFSCRLKFNCKKNCYNCKFKNDCRKCANNKFCAIPMKSCK